MSGPESYIDDLETRYERDQERVGKGIPLGGRVSRPP